MRDGVLDLIDLSPQDYMKLKKQMADYILDQARKK
jgi:predicted metal-binding transcription factor (methanogenesis marker protein 9)